jgi:glycosyltransferase involved in cell wall biosynthesis
MKLWILIFIFVANYLCANPRVSIITSVFKGDDFIELFMSEIVKQTIFNQCELILINANSPGNEESVIMPYLEKYPNITYIKLDQDPGIYGVWNIAIKMACSDYIANANLDDGLAYNAYEVFAKTLDENLDVDLVYSDCYIVYTPNKTFYNLNTEKIIHRFYTPEFSYKGLLGWCFPHNHPMWRKSMHEKYGYFDESFFSAGDYEMWLRAASQGSKFKKVAGVYGFYYSNKNGLSGGPSSKGREEGLRIDVMYKNIS